MATTTADELRTIETNIPARLDRLPWSGVKAERRRLEGIAKPLTAVSSDVLRGTPAGGGAITARAR